MYFVYLGIEWKNELKIRMMLTLLLSFLATRMKNVANKIIIKITIEK